MRKSKLAKLFDWPTYLNAQTTLSNSPDDQSSLKKAAAQDKALQAFQAHVTKDIKLGLKTLQEAVKKGEEASVPYYLHLDYFAQAEAGSGSLLILGTQPAIRKAFVAAGKTPEKVNLSFGTAQLDANNILRFVPEKNGMKVKPKPLVQALKQAPIAKSNPGFWSKRKINNVIIGAEEEQADLTGNSDLVDEAVTYTEQGVNSEIYDAFKVFVNRDYLNSNGTRNAEYYAQILAQVDDWTQQLQTEYKTKGDQQLKAAYQQMGKTMLAFKKKVQQEMQEDTAQHINEESSLSSFEQVFERTLDEYQASEDAYQRSVLKGKLERIALELEQKANGDKAATALLEQFRTAITNLSDSSPTVDAETQAALETLLSDMKTLLAALETVTI
jgi:hypothetical protein